MDDVLSIGLLGPLEVEVGRQPVEMPAGRLRSLLAVLAMSAGQTVPVDRLAAAVWGTDLPANPRRSIQTYVGRLRGALGPDWIGTSPAGYVLQVAPARVDVLRFLDLVDAAAAEPEPSTRRTRLIEALGLWRGTPFVDVPSALLARSETPRLLERYLAGVELRIDLDIAAGRHRELVAELSGLATQYPLRESLWVRLLVVLDGAGRHAEALSGYEAIRLRLADELGTDPGPDLQRIHADLLAGRRVPPARHGVTGPEVRRPVPRQLPADLDVFTGRAAQLRRLDALLSEHPASTAVVAVHGVAGVGKTALVVHWAHRVRDRFDDGQLYTDLRGYGRHNAMVEPADALRGFLDALGVQQAHLPDDVQALAGLYRSLMADRSMLVVLDNARDAEQVRPLLPGGPGCRVVVTSRSHLSGLVIASGAHSLSLGPPGPGEARRLLVRRLGDDRAAADPGAIDDILQQCGRLPLALAVVSARATIHPAFPLAVMAAQLRDAGSNLDVLATTDPTTDVRTVLSWSYGTLSSGAAALFRQLACHPGPDLTVPAAASLAGLTVRRTWPLVAELAAAHLIDEHAPGRYRMHDLVHTYAGELAGRYDTEAIRATAACRALDHYLHTAYAASLRLGPNPFEQPIPPPSRCPDVAPEDMPDEALAVAWFAAEHPVLLAAVRRASGSRSARWCVALASAIWVYLARRGRWHDIVAVEQEVLRAVRRLPDRAIEAAVHCGLGVAYQHLGREADGHRELRSALARYLDAGDAAGLGRTHLTLAWTYDMRGNHREGLDHSRQALARYRDADDLTGQAYALNAIGRFHCALGDPALAVDHCEQALSLHQQIGHRDGEATTWDSLGYAHRRLGQHEHAIACYQRGLELRRRTGHRYGEAQLLLHLAEAFDAATDAGAALHARRLALAILDDLGHPSADDVRGTLHAP